jgi:Uncharacterized protein involved in formate dehydrogenase formation
MSRTQVQDAAAALVSLRPAYAEMIAYYAEIFALQEEALPRVRLAPLRLDAAEVKRRQDRRQPVLPPPEMSFDAAITCRLFAAICRLSAAGGTPLAAAGRTLEADPGAVVSLSRALLDGGEQELRQAASLRGVAPEALSFFLLHSLRPSLMRNESRAAALFAAGFPGMRGKCPVCGSPPVLSWIEADGRRSLLCRFCGHRWAVRRCGCPFCEADDPRRLFFRQSEEEPEYRLHFCEGCRSYWKEVDGRLLSRPAYPPLEHIASLHLDLLATRLGYRPL